VASSTGRLRLAPDAHSDTGCGGRRTRQRQKAPLLLTEQSRCLPHQDAGPATPHRLPTNEGADMAKNTRGPSPHDRWTRDSGVNITPPSQPGPVTTTPTVA
jgi:hypothetical protein